MVEGGAQPAELRRNSSPEPSVSYLEKVVLAAAVTSDCADASRGSSSSLCATATSAANCVPPLFCWYGSRGRSPTRLRRAVVANFWCARAIPHDIAPLPDWNEPAAHGVHSAEPSDGAKVPAPQSSGADAPAIE